MINKLKAEYDVNIISIDELLKRTYNGDIEYCTYDDMLQILIIMYADLKGHIPSLEDIESIHGIFGGEYETAIHDLIRNEALTFGLGTIQFTKEEDF